MTIMNNILMKIVNINMTIMNNINDINDNYEQY